MLHNDMAAFWNYMLISSVVIFFKQKKYINASQFSWKNTSEGTKALKGHGVFQKSHK